jgi:hypothetical protein
MGASIHIKGTGSSIIDTIFVCRSAGLMHKKWLADSAYGIAQLVSEDLKHLKAGNIRPSPGDTRCIAYGHLIRLAIWSLRKEWDRHEDIASRMRRVNVWIQKIGGWPEVERLIHAGDSAYTGEDSPLILNESVKGYGELHDYVSF